jgi:hypothetical protein|tara:strand:- start:12561 stop:12905 length:345 start_codon:yes stop_codon:yes gene_type:complete
MKDKIYRVFSIYLEVLKKSHQPEIQLDSSTSSSIHQAIVDFGYKEVILVMEYLKDSNDNYAMFMRGQAFNSTQAWLDLRTIFKEDKWQDKVKKSEAWKRTREQVQDLYIPFRIK